MAKKVAVLGSGVVGETLANGFVKKGYQVMRASRDPQKLEDWKNKCDGKASTGTFEHAAKWGDIVVLCVKGAAAESALNLAGEMNLIDKTVIDTCNPIAEKPPVNGVIQFFTGPNDSLMERLQAKFPKTNFVKAFSCVGNGLMVDPQFEGQKPSMFICGNNSEAKGKVHDILIDFGWEIEDMGKVESARAIEPLCVLWCIPGMLNNSWNHAFKLLKK